MDNDQYDADFEEGYISEEPEPQKLLRQETPKMTEHL
jgi:hypothetical protein